MGNIKIKVQGGLHTDYGIFNLDIDMIHYVKVDIITSGAQYVESLDANFLHGSTSGLRDYEGIKAIDSAVPNWENYGPLLATTLTNYFTNKITSMSSQELWENYSLYANQFSVEFEKVNDQDDSSYSDTNMSYISYTNDIIPFDERKYQTHSLLSLTNEGIEIKAYMIHFSKYYPIYNSVSGSQQTLRPLLYYTLDLDTYNMNIYEAREQGEEDLIGIPYVNTLIGLEWYRHKSGWTRYEEIHHTVRSFDANVNVGQNIIGAYGDSSVFCNEDESSGSGHDWSQFATNPKDRPTFENYSTKNWGGIPEGFSLWGLGGNHGYYMCPNNNTHWDDRTTLPDVYRRVFNPQSQLRLRSGSQGGHVHGGDGGNDSFIGVMFRLDKNNNHHIFNTYFPVQGNEYNNGKITQVIKYKNAKPEYPKYVGMVLASILTSIYIYGDEPSGTIKYISDIVYLDNHSTIFTKDIVYRAYVEFPENSGNTNNDMLLIRGSHYNTYLASLKTFISEENDDPDGVFNDTNVTLDLKECVKNVPLQFKLDYIQPDLNAIGLKSSVKVLNIDGSSYDCISDGVKPNQLYYIDNNKLIQFFNKLFKIKWLKSLKKQDDKLIGVYDSSKAPTDNPYLCNSINYDEGKLGFNTSKLTSYTNGQCYCIYSMNGSYGNILSDLLINDILVPAARVS